MTVPPALMEFNASNGTHVIDLVEILLAGDVPSPLHDTKVNL